MGCRRKMKEAETDITKQKKIIRKNVLAMRDSISISERRQYDAQIITTIMDMNKYREAKVILAYASYRSEVDTSVLIRQALTDGKNVFVPKVSGDEMEFWQITEQMNLQEGYRGIPEPEELISLPEWIERRMHANEENEQENKIKDVSIDGNSDSVDRSTIKMMMWMPGAVFDKERHRIGYGRGFYDRYLNCFSRWEQRIGECHSDTEMQLMTVALAYHCQVLERIPCEPHDIRPDMIITEAGIFCDEQMS